MYHQIILSPPCSLVRILNTFPLRVAERLPNVFHLGFHSKQSFGAASYFVTATE
jgi:hypothetical protein